ncbi:hypothetical protein ACFL1Y_00970 [Patescibacteria group bacterium]
MDSKLKDKKIFLLDTKLKFSILFAKGIREKGCLFKFADRNSEIHILKQAEEFDPDLIIIDFSDLTLQGMKFARILKSDQRFKDVLIIGLNPPKILVGPEEKTIYEFINDPFIFPRIFTSIKKALKI